MGKPFSRELELIDDIYNWAASVELPFSDEEISPLFQHQTLFVGSGGSLSACYLGAKLHERFGHIARAITPLELLQSTALIQNSNVVLISASGKNSDILQACEVAKLYGAKNIVSIVMKSNSPLAKKTKLYEYSSILELDIPSGKDGFLATNTLVSFFTLLLRMYKISIPEKALNDVQVNLQSFIDKLHQDFTLIVLHSGWSLPVAYDIESKFSEAGLGNVLITDYRNFAHGRHNWLDKKRKQTAIIELITPSIRSLSEKTIKLLPKDIPLLRLESLKDDPTAALELLVKAFHLANEIGKHVGIDPGRPGVPDYGSKLYRLTYPKDLIPQSKELAEHIWIQRKTRVSSLALMSDSEISIIAESMRVFRNNINNEKFGGLIFDYDGTLCTARERYDVPSKEISQSLNKFLEKGYCLGVVTGRGGSVREALCKVLSPKYLSQVIIGYYNGSQTGNLTVDNLPLQDIPLKPNLKRCYNALSKNELISQYIKESKISIRLKPHMIEVQISKGVFFPIKSFIRDLLLLTVDATSIKILESSHSMDIIDAKTSKLAVVESCMELAEKMRVPSNFICIGDRGSWPGNDYQLLSSEFSLSVDQASPSLTTCWDMSVPGVRGVSATIEYINSIKFYKGYFKIQL
ncbi:MAG: hypothetical protein QM731_28555 [Chitinophagaceae bacterium]